MSKCKLLNNQFMPSHPCLVEYRNSFYDNIPAGNTTVHIAQGTSYQSRSCKTKTNIKSAQKIPDYNAPPASINHRNVWFFNNRFSLMKNHRLKPIRARKPRQASNKISAMSATQMQILKTQSCCELNNMILSQAGISTDPKHPQKESYKRSHTEPVVEQINRQFRSILSASVSHLSTTIWSVTRLYDERHRRQNRLGSFKGHCRSRRSRLSSSADQGLPLNVIRQRKNKKKSNQIFGRSLITISQQSGHPLPQPILKAMVFLIHKSTNAIGIFRKPGLKSRIELLCDSLEDSEKKKSSIRSDSGLGSTEIETPPEFNCPYDVADLCKRFFRELPEPLLTKKLSPVFLKLERDKLISTQKLYGLQLTVHLLPDENRLTFFTLLWFLNEIAKNSDHHQMTIPNLSTCFAPTIFAFSEQNAFFPTQNKMSTDDFKEVMEQKLAVSCLAFMVENYQTLCSVPSMLLRRCNFTRSQWDSPCSLKDLKKRFNDVSDSCPKFVDRCVTELIKESHEKGRRWALCHNASTKLVRVSRRKLSDGCPLPLWKVTAEIDAKPEHVLDLILNRRAVWDEDFIEGKILKQITQSTEIFVYSQRNMFPHPFRQFTEFRCNRRDVKGNGDRVLLCTSISVNVDENLSNTEMDRVEAVTMAARFLIKPIENDKSRLVYLCRMDLRGYSPQWYWKIFGYILQRQVTKMRESFALDSA